MSTEILAYNFKTREKDRPMKCQHVYRYPGTLSADGKTVGKPKYRLAGVDAESDVGMSLICNEAKALEISKALGLQIEEGVPKNPKGTKEPKTKKTTKKAKKTEEESAPVSAKKPVAKATKSTKAEAEPKAPAKKVAAKKAEPKVEVKKEAAPKKAAAKKAPVKQESSSEEESEDDSSSSSSSEDSSVSSSSSSEEAPVPVKKGKKVPAKK